MRLFVAYLVMFLCINAEESPLFDVVKIDTRLENGARIMAFGIWLQDGYILSALEAVHRASPLVFAREIKVMSVDTLELPLIFFGEAQPILLDEDRGMALLKMVRYSDAYGNLLHERHPFHEAVMRRRGVDLGGALSHEGLDSPVFYPKEQKWKNLTLETQPSAERFLGAGIFDNKSRFIGILRRGDVSRGVFDIANTSEIRDFICQLTDKNMMLPFKGTLASFCEKGGFSAEFARVMN